MFIVKFQRMLRGFPDSIYWRCRFCNRNRKCERCLSCYFNVNAKVVVLPELYGDLLSYFYRPQRSWGKVMFLHVSVILSTGRKVSGRHPPPGQTPLSWADHPRQTLPWAESPLVQHPPWGETHPADTPRHIPLGRHPPGRHPR